MALSISTPVGLPFTLIISPPTTVVSGLKPANCNAFVLAMAACPSIRVSSTGFSGKNLSSKSLVGNSLTSQSF